MKFITKHTNFLLLFLLTQSTFADREFDIFPMWQEFSLWCWAACCEMVFTAYKIPSQPDQFDAANYAVGGANLANELGGKPKSVDKVLLDLGSIHSNYTPKPSGNAQGTITKTELSTEINEGRPIIASVAITDGINPVYLHDVLIIGYTGSGGSDVANVIYNDPSGTGSREELNYTNFVRSNRIGWYETLRLVTNPRTPIRVGFYDWVRISDGGTTTVTPSTTSLSYTAVFHDDATPTFPVSWHWKLIFVHSYGEYIARSWDLTSSTAQITWNINNFSLPTGYQWLYNYDGVIPGRLELVLLDSDNCQHLDAINVIYVPTNTYPGVLVYSNKTVSSSQPEVKAHQMIVTQNDLFSPGGNITFRSGERININDGITIHNGCSTNFVIDPSIR